MMVQVPSRFTAGSATSIYFGPFSHSGAGGAVQVVTATDDFNVGAESTEEVPEVLCGVTPDGGQASGPFCEPSTDPTVPTGAILAQSAPGSFMAGGSSGQVQTYVLVDDAGFIVQSNATGLFTQLGSGDYTVYAVNFRDGEVVDLFLLPGEDFTPVLEGLDGTSGTDLDNACYTVCDTDPAIMVVVDCFSIGSTVFTDLNDNATLDVGTDMGIPGVTVELVNAGGMVIATDMTDGMGNYFFGGLDAGTYTVQIPTTPDGYPISSTDPTPPEDVATGDNMDSGTQAGGAGTIVVSPMITLAAGTEPNATAGNETGQGGDQDDDIVGATTTSRDDANGDMTVDFGFVPAMSLGSTVFYDPDNDGMQDMTDPLEGGIAGVTINVYAEDPASPGNPDLTMVIATDVTDANGDYFIDNLPPGNYFVGATPVMGSDVTNASDVQVTTENLDGNNNGAQGAGATPEESISGIVMLVAGMEPTDGMETFQGGMQDTDDANGDMTVDFGFVPTNSVGSTVFFDMNDDGEQDGANEVGVSGVDVNLLADPDGDGTFEVVAMATTDMNGDYFFPNLPDGDYQVVLPNGVTGGDASSVVSNDPADQDVQNGTMQGDGSIQSDVFTLTAGDDPTELDGTTGDDQDADDAANNIFDANGNMTIDFGVVPTMSLGSTVFYDVDDSGAQDSDNPLESGIAGATVNLYFDANGDGTLDATELMTPIATTVTDAEGDYLFDSLAIGFYQVGVLAPGPRRCHCGFHDPGSCRR